MEKMDQTRTDCNLTRMGFPGETPRFLAQIRPIHLVSFVHILTGKVHTRFCSDPQDKHPVVMPPAPA